jgi:hypothetical protein
MTNKLEKIKIGSLDLRLEVKLNDGEIIETPLLYASYGFSENIFIANGCYDNKIKKSIEKYLSKNQNVPLIIATPEKEDGNKKTTEFRLIPRGSINYIKLLSTKTKWIRY